MYVKVAYDNFIINEDMMMMMMFLSSIFKTAVAQKLCGGFR